jgi:hypothetical protein
MLRSLLRDRWLLFLTFLALAIKLFSLDSSRVERYYTYGFYPHFSSFMRLLLGWIPFSVGDILYTISFIFLVLKAWKLIRLLAKRQVKEYLSWILFRKYLRLVLWIYIIFNLAWGLNYDRQGIAHQLDLDVKKYSRSELFNLTNVLAERLNTYAELVDTVRRERLNNKDTLFRIATANYALIDEQYPFLSYAHPCIKPSLFSPVGHLFGFSGYLNPFTGEAQLNSAEPVFVKPFVLDHEIAHQLGYGKENEASFVSWLACRASADIDFRYSVYYELFFDAYIECLQTRDTSFIGPLRRSMHPRVRRDKYEELQFRLKRKNVVEPLVSDFYNNYLKLNNQPKGLQTYNEVTAWLIAYGKKYGWGKL